MPSATTPHHLNKLLDSIRAEFPLPASVAWLPDLLRAGESADKDIGRHFVSQRRFASNVVELAGMGMYPQSEGLSSPTDVFQVIAPHRIGWLLVAHTPPQGLTDRLPTNFRTDLRRMALTRSTAAFVVSRSAGVKCPEQEYARASTHEFAQLALMKRLGKPYELLLRQMLAEFGDVTVIERAAMDFDHRDISQALWSHWGLDSAAPSTEPPLPESTSVELSPDSLFDVSHHLARFIMDRDEVNWTRLLEWGAEHIAAERDLVELWLEESTSILSKVLPHFGIAWQHSWTYRRERRQSPRCQVSQTPSSSDDVYGPGLRTPTDNSDSSNTSRRVFVDIERLEPLLKAAVLSSDISLQTLDSTRGSGEVGDPTGSTLGTANASSNSEAEENTTAHEPSSAPHASLVKKTYTSERRLQLSLRHVLQNCRQHRWPAALVFVEIDKIPVDSQGVPDERFAKPLDRFHDLLNDLRHESDLLWQMNPIRWSILLQDCDRAEAVHQCRQHQEGIRDWSQDCSEQGRLALTASFGIAGIAQIPRNFDVNELLIRARRCLSGARLSGGDTLKSISV